MNNLVYDVLLELIAVAISIYTLSFALWLWRNKKVRGALGVAFLALLSVLYPGFVLFFVHK